MTKEELTKRMSKGMRLVSEKAVDLAFDGQAEEARRYAAAYDCLLCIYDFIKVNVKNDLEEELLAHCDTFKLESDRIEGIMNNTEVGI